MRKTALVGLVLMAQPVFAGDFNPFLGKQNKEKAPKAIVSAVKSALTATSPAPLPAIPPAVTPAPFRPNMDGRPGLIPQDKAVEPKAGFTATGRIGDQVVLMDRFGVKSIVQNGTMRGGCFVKFPNVICDKDEVAQAKKEFAAEIRAKAEEEEALAAQEEKVRELSTALSKMQEDLNAALASKVEANGAIAQVAALKTALEEEKGRWAVAQKELGDLQQKASALQSVNSELIRERAEARKSLAKLAETQKKLDEALERGAKTERDLAALKGSIAAPPEWVKGVAKHYNDPVLGKVRVSKADGKVFFQVSPEGEDPADKLFGKNVVRKERKGGYAYYALNAHNVRVKE